MTLRQEVQKLMKKAKARIATFDKHGIDTKAMRELECKLELTKGKKASNLYSVEKGLSQAQLEHMKRSLEYFNNSMTYSEYIRHGKNVYKELFSKKRATREQAINVLDLLDRVDDFIRDEHVYDAISRDTLNRIISTAPTSAKADTMKIRLANIIAEQGKQNVDLSTTLDKLGLDIGELYSQ